MTVFPELSTRRLKLRKLDVDDFPALVRYANNKKIADRILNVPHPYQESHAVFRISYVVQGFKLKSRYVFAIILRERNELIGEISLHLEGRPDGAELGYWIGEPFWNQGLATEAIGAVLKFGFDTLGLEAIYGTCHLDNAASGKALIRHGFAARKVDGNVAVYVQTQSQYRQFITTENT